jgi:hypothetical protein
MHYIDNIEFTDIVISIFLYVFYVCVTYRGRDK